MPPTRSHTPPTTPGGDVGSGGATPVPVPATTHAASARFLRVLGDPTRLAIIEHLLTGPLTVGELVEKIGGPQSRISNHLARLRWCDFVTTERHGRQMLYTITNPRLRHLLDLTTELSAPHADLLAHRTRMGPQWT